MPRLLAALDTALQRLIGPLHKTAYAEAVRQMLAALESKRRAALALGS